MPKCVLNLNLHSDGYPPTDKLAGRAVRLDYASGHTLEQHWQTENRARCVRDFTYDEDRCRAHVRHLPRNLSCLTNAAIAIVRCGRRFSCMPEASRHYAARAQEALDLIQDPPGA